MKAFDTTTLGGRIATARRARKLTQTDLAKLVGITQSSVALLESGSSKSSHNAIELAEALRVPVDWLINGEGPAPFADTSGSSTHNDSGESIVLTAQKSLGSFAERMTFLREERQLTQAQLAAKSGLSQATIGNLETGRNKGTKKILELAKALHITPEWLINGGNLAQAKAAFFRKDMGVLSAEETSSQHLKGLISRAEMAPVAEEGSEHLLGKPTPLPSRKLPIISWMNEALSTPNETHLSHQTEGWFLSPFEHSPQAFWMRICFDVMEPIYLENDLILVDPTATPNNNDDVVVRDARGNTGFGRLRRTLSERYLETFNPKYPDRMHRLEESTVIVGTVTGLVRQRRAMA